MIQFSFDSPFIVIFVPPIKHTLRCILFMS